MDTKLTSWKLEHEDFTELDLSKLIWIKNTCFDFSFLLEHKCLFNHLSKIEFYENLKDIYKVLSIFHVSNTIDKWFPFIIDIRDGFQKVLKKKYGLAVLPYLYKDKNETIYCLLNYDDKINSCEIEKILLTTKMFYLFKQKNQRFFK